MNALGGRFYPALLAVFIALTPRPAIAHGSFEQWAESALAMAGRADEASFPMRIEDRFPARLALGGIKAETACSGSIWVYDYVHHIAAGYDGSPEMILFIGDPPIKLPSRDLSHIVSNRGVHLGQTPEEVAFELHVPKSDVVRRSRQQQTLSLQKPVRFPGDNHTFYDLANIVFNNGRAVSIWLAHDEN